MTLDMGLRVWREKILLVLFIRNLEDNTLSKQVYEEQKIRKWPGLAKETSQICSDLDIEDCNCTNMDIQSYKKILTMALHRQNEKKLGAQAVGKCERILNEEYGKKAYISNTNILNVRQCFRSRFGLQPFAGNYSHDKRFARTGWLCRCLEAREDKSHIMSGQSKIFGDIVEKFSDLTTDENLVEFFSAVLTRRDQLDEQEQGL